ncbi:MAG: DEAD/DEAH box helicase [Dongiaceae bacterium]
MSFTDLGLSEDVLKAVADTGYTTPTPIQEQAIPQVLYGRDLVACAQTGTGKTASFILPMIDILSSGRPKARMPRSLILEPTRELAAQVAENFQTYGKYHPLSMALLIGGMAFEEQEKALERGVDVLIATPGRLLDHFNNGKVLLNDVKIFVLDEADRMLDMGFIPDIEEIVKKLPTIRQTLMFSATMAPEIRRLASAFLMNPREIHIAPQTSTATTVTQYQVKAPSFHKAKRDTLRAILRHVEWQNAMIFSNRKTEVDVIAKSLQKHGFKAAAMHGDMPQSARNATLEKFKQNEITLLVCSDVAARGLDIDDLSLVINYDVPFNAEDYVHRIGRTGRAGKEGTAIMIVTRDDDKTLSAVTSLIKKEIPLLPNFESEASENSEEMDAPHARAGRYGRRNRHQGGRNRFGKKAAPQQDAPPASSAPPAPREKKFTPPKHSQRRQEERRGEQPRPRHSPKPAKGEKAPVAFGEHVPSFMARKP